MIPGESTTIYLILVRGPRAEGVVPALEREL
jgi:hypothetical protein